MIMSIITAIMARWQIAVAVAGLLIASHGLTYCKGRDDGKEAAEAKYAAMQAAALEKARKADTVAQDTVTKGQNDVEAGNQRARDAAKGSVDPLRSFTDSLRRETRPNSSAR